MVITTGYVQRPPAHQRTLKVWILHPGCASVPPAIPYAVYKSLAGHSPVCRHRTVPPSPSLVRTRDTVTSSLLLMLHSSSTDNLRCHLRDRPSVRGDRALVCGWGAGCRRTHRRHTSCRQACPCAVIPTVFNAFQRPNPRYACCIQHGGMVPGAPCEAYVALQPTFTRAQNPNLAFCNATAIPIVSSVVSRFLLRSY